MGHGKSLALYSDVWRAVVDIQYPQITSKTISNWSLRCSNEGITFPTKVLPLLYKRTLKALETGTRLETMSEFCVDNANRPHLFNELFTKLFSDTGLPYDIVDPNGLEMSVAKRVEALQCLNQLTMLLYKLKFEPSGEQKEEAWSSFKIRNDACAVTYVDDETLIHARRLVKRVLGRFDLSSVMPRHGAGAVSEGMDPHQRRRSIELYWPDKLDRVFPFEEFAFINWDHMSDVISPTTGHSNYRDAPSLVHTVKKSARLAFVPKDSRGPRSVFLEPAAHQYCQQGVMNLLMDKMEASSHGLAPCFPLRSQVTQHMRAKLGSLDGSLATIDFSAASDTVSHDIVWKLFGKDWCRAFDACRSESVVYNDEVVQLSIFAPMGASICFPVECIVFWAICASVCRDPRQVTVYGDDVVIPVQYVEELLPLLERYGFQPNVAKSYYRGKYRESCGEEYYHGQSVKAVLLRNLDHDPAGLEARRMFYNTYVSHYLGSNTFVDVFRRLREIIVSFDGYKEVACTLSGAPSSFLAPFSSSSDTVRTRWNRHLQRGEVRVTYFAPVTWKFASWRGLFEYLLSRSSRPVSYQPKVRKTQLRSKWAPID